MCLWPFKSLWLIHNNSPPLEKVWNWNSLYSELWNGKKANDQVFCSTKARDIKEMAKQRMMLKLSSKVTLYGTKSASFWDRFFSKLSCRFFVKSLIKTSPWWCWLLRREGSGHRGVKKAQQVTIWNLASKSSFGLVCLFLVSGGNWN